MGAVKEPRRAQSEREKKRQRRGRQTASRQKCSARDAATKRSKISVISFSFSFSFFGGEFSPFSEIVSGKRILSQIHCFPFKIREKTILGPKKIRQKSHNCPQYERVFKIFYFYILSIAKFG